MTQPIEPRTKGEALLDLSYAIRLHRMSCRRYRKLKGVVAFTTLILGMAAVISALQSLPYAIGIAGIVIGTMSVIDVLGGFGEKATRHNHWREQYEDLSARSAEMTLDQLDAERKRIARGVDNEVEALRVPAYNDNLASCGYESMMRPETFRQRLARVLA
jgi:hypothetical protein